MTKEYISKDEFNKAMQFLIESESRDNVGFFTTVFGCIAVLILFIFIVVYLFLLIVLLVVYIPFGLIDKGILKIKTKYRKKQQNG
jgi:hypothetical protein